VTSADDWIITPRDPLHLQPTTDLGNALRLLAAYGNRFRHNDAMEWMVWDGRIWRPDDSAAKVFKAAQSLQELLRADGETAKALGYSETATDLAKAVKRSQQRSTIVNALTLWKPHAFLAATDFDQHPTKVTVANGTLDLDGRTLSGFDPSLHGTRMMPVEYNEHATAPFFEETLAYFVPDVAEREYLQRLAGYCMTTETGEQQFTILHGKGANAKSTILEGFRQVLGRGGDRGFSQEVNPRVFEARTAGSGAGPDPERFGLLGMRLVTPVETSTALKLDAPFIKSITGGEAMTARDVYKSSVTWKPGFKIIMATNHAPSIDDDSYGMWRRVHRLNLTQVKPEEKRLSFDEVMEHLTSQRSGILNWMLDGFDEWRKHGLAAPPSVLMATEEMRLSQDRLGTFLAESTVARPGYAVERKVLWDAFNHWRHSDDSMRRMGRNEFYEAMRDRLGPEDGYRRFVGVDCNFPFHAETPY
jgi:putative DNA primase/helicase